MVNKMHHRHLSCEVCERIFQYPSQLRDHMLIHTRIRRFSCDVCGMKFLKDHHLKAHSITHSLIKPFMCPTCGRHFSLKANMERHSLIHSAVRHFKCEQCGKTFAQPQTLKMHMVSHAEVKPFSCNICGKGLSRAHNLRAHMAIHQNNKAHKCTACGSSFTLRGNMHRHQREKHGAIIPSLQPREYSLLPPTMVSSQYQQSNNNETHRNTQVGKRKKNIPKSSKCKNYYVPHQVSTNTQPSIYSNNSETNLAMNTGTQAITNKNSLQNELSSLCSNNSTEHKSFPAYMHPLHCTSPLNATLPQMFGTIPVSTLVNGSHGCYNDHTMFPSTMTNVGIKLQALHAAIDDLAGKLGPSHEKVSALHIALDDMVNCQSKLKLDHVIKIKEIEN